MSDWSGGYAGGRPPGAKIPVKLHRNVALIRTNEPILADELLARSRLAKYVIGRLADDVLLVQPGQMPLVVAELRRLGHTPQVIGGK
jgi:hypothetical protein